MKFGATIPKGKSMFVLNNKPDFERYVESLSHSEHGVNLVLTVERAKKKRSLSQNAYYHVLLHNYIVPALIDLGWEIEETTVDSVHDMFTVDSVHDMFKSMFNSSTKVIEATGEVVTIPMTTSGISTTDFMVYIENIKRWCAQNLDLYLPEPNEQLEIK